MLNKKYDYIQGSTLVKPKRKDIGSNAKIIQIGKRRNIYNRNIILKKQRKNDRRQVLIIIMMIFTIGFITISRDSQVYNMQHSIDELNNEIKQIQENNEALKIKIIKFSSLKNIEKNAQNKLHMYIPKKEDVVRIDFSQNYFNDLK